jgi:hypothetical protein
MWWGILVTTISFLLMLATFAMFFIDMIPKVSTVGRGSSYEDRSGMDPRSATTRGGGRLRGDRTLRDLHSASY